MVMEGKMISGFVWKVIHFFCVGHTVTLSICAGNILWHMSNCIMPRQSLDAYEKRIGG